MKSHNGKLCLRGKYGEVGVTIPGVEMFYLRETKSYQNELH